MRLLAIAMCFVLTARLFAQPTMQTVTLPPDDAAKAKKCQENLKKLDGAKEQLALEFRKAMDTTVTMQNLLDPNNSGRPNQGYLKRAPECPAGGEYKLNAIGREPECSLGAPKGHALKVPIRIAAGETSAEDKSTSPPASKP